MNFLILLGLALLTLVHRSAEAKHFAKPDPNTDGLLTKPTVRDTTVNDRYESQVFVAPPKLPHEGNKLFGQRPNGFCNKAFRV